MARHAARRLTLVALGCLVALVVGTPASAASVEERRLAENRARIAEVRGALEAAGERRDVDADSLERAQAQLQLVLDAVSSAGQAVERQQQAVAGAGLRLAELQQQAADRKDALTERAVALYMQQATSSLESLVTAETAAEALDRSAYAALVARSDRRAFEGLTAAGITVDAQRGVLEAEERSLAGVLEQERALLAEAEAVRDSRTMQLAATDEQLQRLSAQESHLEGESRELAALAQQAARAVDLAPLARAASPTRAVGPPSALAQAVPQESPGTATAPVPVAVSGGYQWPASGPVTSEFGRRWGRAHEGIDIGAPSGAPIVAARSGTVAFAGVQGGYGNLVLISHGDGVVTAYAHQSRILVSTGQTVSAGGQIGEVGSTGNSTGPHLHFEVRVGGSPRNPRTYLG